MTCASGAKKNNIAQFYSKNGTGSVGYVIQHRLSLARFSKYRGRYCSIRSGGEYDININENFNSIFFVFNNVIEVEEEEFDEIDNTYIYVSVDKYFKDDNKRSGKLTLTRNQRDNRWADKSNENLKAILSSEKAKIIAKANAKIEIKTADAASDPNLFALLKDHEYQNRVISRKILNHEIIDEDLEKASRWHGAIKLKNNKKRWTNKDRDKFTSVLKPALKNSILPETTAHLIALSPYTGKRIPSHIKKNARAIKVNVADVESIRLEIFSPSRFLNLSEKKIYKFNLK